MSIEEQLKRALERSAGWPDETGVYDQFLRRRRHGRALAAAGLTLVLVVGLFVVAIRVVPGHVGGGPVSRQDVSGQPLARTEWQLIQVIEPSRTWSPPPDAEAVTTGSAGGRATA
jgi:hypothetical protein